MTIHTEHPFADPDPDPVRRLRGRLGGAVTLWTAGDLAGQHAGLTVSSVMVGRGEPAHVLALVDPDSDLRDRVAETGRAVMHLLQWRHRDLAEAFAGLLPAPGGAFRMAAWEQGSHGPVLLPATGHVALELADAREVGWSDLLDLRVVEVALTEDLDPLEHRRGRYARPGGR